MIKAKATLPLIFTTVILTAFCLLPELVFAAPSFSSGSSQLKNDLIAILTPIVGIAIVVLGVLCAFGKVNWMWFAGAIFGIVLIFGHDQVISWIRTTFSV